MRFLAFLLGWWVYHPFSWLVAIVLRCKGIRVGRGFYIQGVPYLKIRGRPGNITIGRNVKVFGDIDLRNRESGKIVIEDHVSFDTGCRLVAANNATLRFRQRADIGGYCIFNCGTDVTIGEDVLMAGYCYIQSSSHGIKRGEVIKKQPHTYAAIHVGQGAWLGGNATILPGVSVGEGAIVGAKAVVTKDVPAFAICAGIPAKVIGERPV